MGVLCDTEIRKLMRDKHMKNCNTDNILSIGYDLRPRSYYNTNRDHYESVKLHPGDSIFVGCTEFVEMPEDVIASIQLRNSRIRQGLSLEAPVYQPGHSTQLYYRFTNISKSVIELSLEDGSGICDVLPFNRNTRSKIQWNVSK